MRTLKRGKEKVRVFRIIAELVFFVLAISAGISAYKEYTSDSSENKKAENLYNDIAQRAHYKKNGALSESEDTINWEELSGYGVVGWVKFGDLADYPIVQGSDNSYYLKHMYDGTYNSNGAIFMHCDNNSDFMDLNTIIYGHNMSYTGDMFGKLKQMLEYSEENPDEFYIYKPDGTMHTYEVFSVDKVKDLGYAYQTHFKSVEAYKEYKEQLKSNSEYDTGVLDSGSKTVVLSTCTTGSAYGNRIVVVGQELDVKQVQEPATWYTEKKYIEVDNKKAVCYKGNNGSYIVQDGLAIRVRDENVKDIIPDENHVITRVEYTETNEAYEYTDLSGNTKVYPIVDIENYVVE